VRNALVARLVSEAAFKQHPEHAQVPIERPIFVTGLPRTGTTVIHRLLTADPAHQGLELWLAEFPQPRPPRETWSQNPVFQALDAQFTKAHQENPDYTGLHYMPADEVEECWQLLRQSLHSVSYETLAHIPTYSLWLRGRTGPVLSAASAQPAADRANEPDKRWVLKNPSHLFALDALFATYPDALVVQLPSARRDHHGVDCARWPSTPPRLFEHLPRRCHRRRLDGDLVARAGTVHRRARQARPGPVSRRGLFRVHQGPDRRRRGHLSRLRHRVSTRPPARPWRPATTRAGRGRVPPSTATRWQTTD
jgi:hypothetical protein